MPTRRTVLSQTLPTAASLALPLRADAAHAPRPWRSRSLSCQTSWAPVPAQAPARQGLAELPGVKLFYWDTGGQGAPVVLLHPTTGSAAVWGYQQPVFAKAGYRVIGYSRRGHAGSETGAPDDTATPTDDLLHLLDKLGVERCHLVGAASGGFIGPDFALTYPDRLLSLTLTCTQAGVTDPAFRARIAAISPEGFAKLPAAFRELGPTYRAGYPEGVAAWEALERGSLAPGLAAPPQPPRKPLLLEDFARIQAPTLVIAGGADLLAPSPLVADYARRLPKGEMAVLEAAGHSAYWEQYDGFNELVLEFVRRVPKSD